MIYFLLNCSPDNKFIISETTKTPDSDTLVRTMKVFLEILANTSLCASIPANFSINHFLPETHLSILITLHSHLHSVVSNLEAIQPQTLSHLQRELQKIKTCMISLPWESFNTFSQIIPSYIQQPNLELPTTSSSSPHSFAEKLTSPLLPFSPLASSSSSFGSLASILDEFISSDIDITEQNLTKPSVEEIIITSIDDHFSLKRKTPSPHFEYSTKKQKTTPLPTTQVQDKEPLIIVSPLLSDDTAQPPTPLIPEKSSIASICKSSCIKKTSLKYSDYHTKTARISVASSSVTGTLIEENLPPSSPVLPIASIELFTEDKDDIVSSDDENYSTTTTADQHTQIQEIEPLPITQKETSSTTASSPVSDNTAQAPTSPIPEKSFISSPRRSAYKRKVSSEYPSYHTKTARISVASSSVTATLIEENLPPSSPVSQKSPIELFTKNTDDIVMVTSDNDDYSISTTSSTPISEQEPSLTILKTISPKKASPIFKKRTKKQKLSTELESKAPSPIPQSSIYPSELSYFVLPCFSIRKLCKNNPQKLTLEIKYPVLHRKDFHSLKQTINRKISSLLSTIKYLTMIPSSCDIVCMFHKSKLLPFTRIDSRTDLFYVILMGLKHTLAYYQERADVSKEIIINPCIRKEILSTIVLLKEKSPEIIPSPLCVVPDDVMQQAEKIKIQELKDCHPIPPFLLTRSSHYSLPLFFISPRGHKLGRHYGLFYTCRHDTSENKLFTTCIDKLKTTVTHVNSLIETPPLKITSYDPFSSQKKVIKSFDMTILLILNGLKENLLFFENHPSKILDKPKYNPLQRQLEKAINDLQKIASPSIKKSALPQTPRTLNQILNKEKSKKAAQEKVSTKSKIEETHPPSSQKSMKKNAFPQHLPMFWVHKQAKGVYYRPYKLSYLMRSANRRGDLIKKINTMLEKNIAIAEKIKNEEWAQTMVTWIHPNTQDRISCSSLNEALSLILQGFKQILFYYTKDPFIGSMNILSSNNLEQLTNLMNSISSSTSISPSCLLPSEFIQHMVEAHQKISTQKNPS